MTKSMAKRGPDRRGQAVIEIAAFGAIVLFVIGMIIQQGTSSAYQQNAALQSTRMALLRSFHGTRNQDTAKNSATFFILEDRLVPSGGKYASVDRQPHISIGTGTLSKNLFRPVDWKELLESPGRFIPSLDLRVNGQDFSLRSAAPISYRIRYYPRGTYEASQVTIHRVKGCSTTNVCQTLASCEELLEDSNTAPGPGNERARRIKMEWYYYGYGNNTVPASGWTDDRLTPGYQTEVKGNPTFVSSSKISAEQCADLEFIRQYDFKRDGTGEFVMNPASPESGTNDMACPDTLKDMIWRWRPYNMTGKVDSVASNIDLKNKIYPSFDVDADLSEETVYLVEPFKVACVTDKSGVVIAQPLSSLPPPATVPADSVLLGYKVNVLDWDLGDVDNSSLEDEDGERPGLQEDMQILTKQKDGSFLDITESAKLCSGESGLKPCAQSIVNRNQIDMVGRRYVLSRKMLGGGSLCSDDLQPKQQSVEACCNTPKCCMEGATGGRLNETLTCVELLPNKKTLYIRSRVSDQRGRLWATDTETK